MDLHHPCFEASRLANPCLALEVFEAPTPPYLEFLQDFLGNTHPLKDLAPVQEILALGDLPDACLLVVNSLPFLPLPLALAPTVDHQVYYDMVVGVPSSAFEAPQACPSLASCGNAGDVGGGSSRVAAVSPGNALLVASSKLAALVLHHRVPEGAPCLTLRVRRGGGNVVA